MLSGPPATRKWQREQVRLYQGCDCKLDTENPFEMCRLTATCLSFELCAPTCVHILPSGWLRSSASCSVAAAQSSQLQVDSDNNSEGAVEALLALVSCGCHGLIACNCLICMVPSQLSCKPCQQGGHIPAEVNQGYAREEEEVRLGARSCV